MPWQNLLSIGLLLLSGYSNIDRQVPHRQSQSTLSRQTYRIPTGTVGIVSIRSETPENYQLRIIFPEIGVGQERSGIRLRANDRVRLADSIQLFDAAGVVAKIAKILPVKIDRWCHNDGGIQYRSIVDLIVPKHQLHSAIHKFSRIEKFALFAVVGKSEDLAPVLTSVVNTGTGQHQIIRKSIAEGRQSQTNRLVTRVFEAGNPRWDACDGGENLPSLILETARAKSNLRCCGP
jgi:hypothetical protein